MKKMIAAILLLIISGCAPSETLEGPYKVTDVIDGDTLKFESGPSIRFSGINTPETGECHYKQAKDKLTELVLGKEVYLERDRSNKDKYGRLLRYIYIDGKLVNEKLVEEGYAKAYDKYKSDTKRYDQLKEAEAKAKEKNLGVWSCKDPKEGCAYVASKNSSVYHPADCKWAKKIKPENLICFKSKNEIPKDLKPSKNC